MIAPSLDWIPNDGSSLNKFGMMLNKLWKNLSATFAPFWLAAALYLPVVTAGTGTFTTTSVTGSYYQLGRLVFLAVLVTITTNGTAAGSVNVSLPFTSQSATSIKYMFAGGNNSNQDLIGFVDPNSNVLRIFKYDGTYPGGNGVSLYLSGFYEVS